MKKIIALFLAVSTLLLFGACNETGEKTMGDPAKKAVLVVSFGTSYNDTRALTIDAIEAAVADAYPEYEVRRAFTSQIIIDKLLERDGLEINNVEEAMQQLIADGFGTLVVQPTHVINGYEFNEMTAEIEPFIDNFASVTYGTPLLTTTEGYLALVEAFKNQIAPPLSEDTALLLMGHGTQHFANSAYAALDYMFKEQGMPNVFVGAVESYPDLDTVIPFLKTGNYRKIILQPLMIVAGDHASNDMAGDEEDSWKTVLKAEGFEVECIMRGLGEFSSIHSLYIDQIARAINASVTK